MRYKAYLDITLISYTVYSALYIVTRIKVYNSHSFVTYFSKLIYYLDTLSVTGLAMGPWSTITYSSVLFLLNTQTPLW